MYEMRNQNDLFHEEIRLELDADGKADVNPVQKARMLNAVERLAMFQRILNRYGLEGWKFHSSIVFNGAVMIVFEKETYKKAAASSG